MGIFWHCARCKKYVELSSFCKGCGGKEPSGYLVRIKIDGIVIRKFFKDFDVAKAVYVELEKKKELLKLAKKLKGIDEGLAKVLGVEEEEKGRWIKLKVFWGKYYQWLVLHKKPNTIRERSSRWKNAIKLYFGEKTLSEITPKEVEKFQKWLLEKGQSSCSINRTIAMLRHMLTMAVRWGYLQEHPLKGKIEMLREKKDRWTFISQEQYLAIREKLPETYLDLYDFLVFTGCRLGEALGLRWKDIVWDAGVAYLSDSKANRPRVLYLSDYVIKLLSDRKQKLRVEDENEKVFHHSDGWVRKAFKKALKEAGLPESIRIHDLRHTFASWLAMRGTPLQYIQQLLGHSQISTTLRYAHLLPTTLRQAVNSLFTHQKEQEHSSKIIDLTRYLKKKKVAVAEPFKGGAPKVLCP